MHGKHGDYIFILISMTIWYVHFMLKIHILLKKVITIFWQLDHFLSTFGKKCIFPFENPKTLRKISKNWCWKCKMSCKLLQMLVILHKMTAGPRKMMAAPCKMTAATHLMFAKDQRGGLRSPPRPQGTPPYPYT